MGSLRWFPRARNSCVGDRREQRAGERRAGLAGVGVQRATGQDTPLTASVQATDPAGTIARNQETKQTRRASGRAGCAHAQRERANARAGSAPESSCSADTDAGSKPCLLAFLPFRHSPIPESSSGARGGWVGEGARGRPKPSHRARNREHLLLAARQRFAELGQPLLQPRESLGDALDDFAFALAMRRSKQPELQVFEHRQSGHDTPLFGHVSESAMIATERGLAHHLRAVEEDAATPLRHQSHHRAQRRRFARAIAADQRDDLPGVDFERHALQHVAVPVPRVEIVELQHRPHQCFPCPR